MPQTGAMTFALGGSPLLGLGEGGPQFDRRGSTDGMRSGQGGYQLRTHGGRVPVQWLIDTGGWAMFIHQPFGTFDFTGEDGRFTASDAQSGRDPAAVLPLDLFVVGARDPAAIMAEYARLTGHPEMPPLWSFGYQQSHRTLASRDEILQEAKTFREKKLPCDTMIYLGTGFCPSGWNTDNGEFTFNKNVFPDPKAMIQQLHDDHFKVVLHVVLEGRTLTGTVSDPCTAPPLPSGRTPDGRWPDDRQVSCYWPVHKPLFDVGVDGWWPDQGDGLDAPSRLARNRMYWEGSQQLRPNERPFALHRNGSRRHAALRRVPLVGRRLLDVGDAEDARARRRQHGLCAAFRSGAPTSAASCRRRSSPASSTSAGSSSARSVRSSDRTAGRGSCGCHGDGTPATSSPTRFSNYTGGAANPDPSELHNAAVEPICRKFLELRYRLMPYLYSAVREAHDTGLPIVRAVAALPADRAAVARGDEYLWGRDILVAPVVEKAPRRAASIFRPAAGTTSGPKRRTTADAT